MNLKNKQYGEGWSVKGTIGLYNKGTDAEREKREERERDNNSHQNKRNPPTISPTVSLGVTHS